MSISEFLKKTFSRKLIGNCLGLIIAGTLTLVGALWFIDFYTRHGKEVKVPDICGLDEKTAANKLKALGLGYEVTDTGYVMTQVPFAVLEQSVKAGTSVKPGRVIQLTINADGPRKVTIPDIADNCSRREAEDKLRILGFRLGATEYITGDTDWVYGVKVNGKNVPAGTKVSITSPVTLVVGAGGIEDVYNGNDSLDYILNKPEADDEIDETEAVDAPAGEETADAG